MLNNLITINDIAVLLTKISQRGIGTMASRIFRADQSRVKNVWSATESALTHWWDIPEVQERWNEKITGKKEITLYEYVRENYFPSSMPVKGLSIGCGTGNKELLWIQEMEQLTLQGIDISKQRIAQAVMKARKAGVGNRLSFSVGNIYDLPLRPGEYDMIIFDSSLHHFAPIGIVLDAVKQALSPSGLLIVNEYVGPARFQWTDRQLDIVNELLSTIPESYRKRISRDAVKTKEYRPGRLTMYVSDPSEAVESDKIERRLFERFDVIEKKEYGGTLLQLLFKDIAGNFIRNDHKTKELLKEIFTAEDKALSTGDVKSDFALFIARPKFHAH
ncbi:MAG: class I SAM-dependent methyltransferase [Bacteroidota bacterium]